MGAVAKSYMRKGFLRYEEMIRGVDDSPYPRNGESAIEFFKKKTRCIGDSESRRLPVSLSRRVAERATPIHSLYI
jgi:hypothetical protein